MRAGFLLLLVASVGLVGACSLSSLDDLKQNAGKVADAGSDAPVEAGECKYGVDCSGCQGCDDWCGCVAPTVTAKCISDCKAASGGAGGQGGTPGTGGSSGTGGLGTDGGETGGTGGNATGGTGGTGAGGTGAGGTGTGGGGGNVAGQVICGSTSCGTNNQQCCGGGPGGWSCEPLATNCGGTSITCDGPEDCTGSQVCCGTLNPATQQYDSIVCATSCSQTQNQRTACDPIQSTCPMGQACQASALVPGYHFCG